VTGLRSSFVRYFACDLYVHCCAELVLESRTIRYDRPGLGTSIDKDWREDLLDDLGDPRRQSPKLNHGARRKGRPDRSGKISLLPCMLTDRACVRTGTVMTDDTTGVGVSESDEG
jgi:hypothetical protein